MADKTEHLGSQSVHYKLIHSCCLIIYHYNNVHHCLFVCSSTVFVLKHFNYNMFASPASFVKLKPFLHKSVCFYCTKALEITRLWAAGELMFNSSGKVCLSLPHDHILYRFNTPRVPGLLRCHGQTEINSLLISCNSSGDITQPAVLLNNAQLSGERLWFL